MKSFLNETCHSTYQSLETLCNTTFQRYESLGRMGHRGVEKYGADVMIGELTVIAVCTFTSIFFAARVKKYNATLGKLLNRTASSYTEKDNLNDGIRSERRKLVGSIAAAFFFLGLAFYNVYSTYNNLSQL